MSKSKSEEWVEDQEDEGEKDPRDKKIVELESENRRLSKTLGLVEAYHAAAGTPPKWLKKPKKLHTQRATACIQFSDLHLDEVVNPSEIGGLNAFNRTIAELRLRRWADKACEMGERHKHEWDGAVIFWNGDMISGSIHEELRETNIEVLPNTMVYWAPKIAAAIRQIVDFYGRVHIPCIVGNHGRLTQKKQAKRRAQNSWDWLLSQMVASHFVGDDRVTFDITSGTYLFVPVYDRYAYQTHGDEVHGGNGLAGVWSPLGTLHKKGLELAAIHKLDMSHLIAGHWHQQVLAHHRGICCNGALKGYDEYASFLRLRPEPAMQGWWVETPQYGVTIAGPLFLEDRKKEGW